jgi:hypothetical protein
MKKITLILMCVVANLCANAQSFWLENWTGTTCASLCTTYTGTNGAWKDTAIGFNGAAANVWYYSKTEDANGRGACQTSSSTPSLHIGNVSNSPAASLFCPTGDCGASYDASKGAPSDYTTTMAMSPTINCTGKTGITLSFNYLMNGEAAHDYGWVMYYDGTKWDTLAKPAKVAKCTKKYTWTYYSVSMPASANGNPKVRLGFCWTNDTNNKGTDPSFAVDSVMLSTAPEGVNNIYANTEINVYPNPSHGTFNFAIKNLQLGTAGRVEVYNMLGQQVLNTEINKSQGGVSNTLIAVPNSNAGIYFYRIVTSTGDIVKTGKLIVE